MKKTIITTFIISLLVIGFVNAQRFDQLSINTNRVSLNSFSNTFLKIDKIKGESSDDQHKYWIDLTSFQKGVKTFTFTKSIDQTSSKLNLALTTNQRIKEATMEICKLTGVKQCNSKYRFKDIVITSINQDSISSTETISFSYKKLERTYISYDSYGRQLPSITYKE